MKSESNSKFTSDKQLSLKQEDLTIISKEIEKYYYMQLFS